MKCPNCQRENKPDSRYCIFCDSILPTPEAEQPSGPVSGPMDALPEQVQALQEDVSRLRELITLMNDRLAAVESTQAIPAPEPTATPPTAVTPAPETAPAPEPIPAAPAAAAPRLEAPPAVTRPPPPPLRRRPPATAIRREWEQILGRNWLARIGVLALIIGVGFFLKFAFDQNWLGPTARVILGVLAGIAMVGAGYNWRIRYPTFAQALSGGGIALLYLSIFAAFNIFHLIPFYPAVGLLLLISVGSAVLAIRLNSMTLAIIGIFGAFSAPFILGMTTPGVAGAAAAGQGIQLLVYVMVIDVGVLVLSTFRNWRWFTLLALFSSLLAFAGWYDEFGSKASLLTSQISITLIFLIFVGATSLFHLLWRKTAQGFDYGLMVVNTTAYLGISYGFMWDDLRAWIGGFTLLLALFYGGFAYAALRRGVEDTRLSFFALGIAFVLLTIAIPVQLGDKAWTTIAWAAEGTVLMWLALNLRIPHFRNYSYAVFSIVAFRLVFFDTTVDIREFNPVLNERFLAFIVSIAAMYFVAYLLWQNRGEGRRVVYSAFVVAANFFTLWIIGAEVISYREVPATLQASLSLIILLVLAGATTLHHVLWRRSPQTFDLVLTVFNAAVHFGISAVLWEELRVWMGGLYFVFALCYGSLTYASIKRGPENTKLGSLALGIALVFFTVALAVQLGNTAWTTVAWAAELAVLMWLSFALRMTQLRNYSYAVFVITAIRLLFFDTSVDLRTFQPVLNERFLAFLVSIIAMYSAAYFLWRGRMTLPEWSTPASTFLVAANFFTLWLLSFEVWHYFGSLLAALESRPASIALENTQKLSLTAVWAIYAVILLVIGIIKRSRPARLGALALFAVVIVKVFVYDVFALEQVYRIIAFVGLGILLLVSGYLYQRYGEAIKGFLVTK
jgi:uncharacterized membrane protein